MLTKWSFNVFCLVANTQIGCLFRFIGSAADYVNAHIITYKGLLKKLHPLDKTRALITPVVSIGLDRRSV